MKRLFSMALIASMIMSMGISSWATSYAPDSQIYDESEDTDSTGTSSLFVVEVPASPTPTPTARQRWNNLNEYQKYNKSAKEKAKHVGLSEEEFKFFSSVVQAEGDIKGNDLSDKVLVACVIWNRKFCKIWPNTITKVLQQDGQFEVVNSSGNCIKKPTRDSDYAVLLAYDLVTSGRVSAHLFYFNSINYMRGKADYAYYGGNYFSADNCSCSRCASKEPHFSIGSTRIHRKHYYRPTPSSATPTPTPTPTPDPVVQETGEDSDRFFSVEV